MSSTYGDPETRRRILDAARGLLEEAGTGVRMADVAARAGVSRQSVYLHFGDRSGLMVALVEDIDARHGAGHARARILDAPTAVESLQRWIRTIAGYSPTIDRITEVLEHGSTDDESLAAAWRDRMGRRRQMARAIVARLADEGMLDPSWTIDDATDLAYVVTMPAPWRELTSRLGWDEERYAERLTALLTGALVGRPGS